MCINSVLNVKVLVGAFNQKKALVGALSVIVKTGCGTDGSVCGTGAGAAVSPAAVRPPTSRPAFLACLASEPSKIRGSLDDTCDTNTGAAAEHDTG